MPDATPPVPPAPPAKPSKNRRSRAEEAELARAKKTLAALPPLLPAIAKKDANAAKVRIDKAWGTQYGSIITSAEAASAGRTIARVDLKAATLQERQTSDQLGALLVDVRERVATHNPDDARAQEAYGRGAKISTKRTAPTLALADTFLTAWGGSWKQAAVDAGVTQAEADQIKSLRDSLSSADVGQQGVITSNVDNSVERAALFSTLRTMSTFAARVVANVFGKTSSQLGSLSDPRPLTNRAADRKAATKAKKVAKKAAAKAAKAAKPKKTAPAALKRRARQAMVATRKAALVAVAKPAAKAKAKAKPAKKRG